MEKKEVSSPWLTRENLSKLEEDERQKRSLPWWRSPTLLKCWEEGEDLFSKKE